MLMLGPRMVERHEARALVVPHVEHAEHMGKAGTGVGIGTGVGKRAGTGEVGGIEEGRGAAPRGGNGDAAVASFPVGEGGAREQPEVAPGVPGGAARESGGNAMGGGHTFERS